MLPGPSRGRIAHRQRAPSLSGSKNVGHNAVGGEIAAADHITSPGGGEADRMAGPDRGRFVGPTVMLQVGHFG